jgi:hypothetical protein
MFMQQKRSLGALKKNSAKRLLGRRSTRACVLGRLDFRRAEIETA